MHTKLIIPEKINVGFQNRKETYTGKLAYVIYYDHKGVLRKENSWTSWRDKNIEPEEFQNKPLSGFVINKNVGGVNSYSHSWEMRTEKVRVFDPRGFEIEITIPNLLFILNECTSTKGKGLEGEFVYSWSGSDLILLPTSCVQYSESMEFTNLQKPKITKSSMVAGRIYKFKDNQIGMYLGRLNTLNKKYKMVKFFQNSSWSWASKKEVELKDSYSYENEINHVFLILSENNQFYRYEKGFTKIGEIVNENIDETFSDKLEDFLTGKYSSKPIDIIELQYKDKLNPENKNRKFWTKIDDKYIEFILYNKTENNQTLYDLEISTAIYKENDEIMFKYNFLSDIFNSIEHKIKGIKKVNNFLYNVNFEELKSILINPQLKLESGKIIPIYKGTI